MPAPSARIRALVTGAAGFVGGHLVRELLARGWVVRAAVRAPWKFAPDGVEQAIVPDVGPRTDWAAPLDGVEVVFHLAARAHAIAEAAADPVAEFERVNAAGTARLAACARIAGVRRIVAVSTIGVHGDVARVPALTESSPLAPASDYARSKLHGEQAVRAESGHGLEYAVVRPPLIYGACVPGNFRRLLRIVASGIPLPLGRVENSRSLAAVGNVVDVLRLCGEVESAAGETFVVADGQDLSTPALVRALAAGMGAPARLLPMPVAVLRAAARIAGREREFRQLCESLRVDASKARARLDWCPRYTPPEALRTTARWYARSRGRTGASREA
jgi:UDP-N-acetyl-alpha-D-quinovosamine dehydrogenase